MKEVLINEYGNTKILGLPHKKPENIFNINFTNTHFIYICVYIYISFKFYY